MGLGHSPAALYLENGHPAGPVQGKRAASGASGLVLGRPIQLPRARVSRVGGAALGLNHAALGSEVLGLWVELLVSAPNYLGGFRCGRPSGVSSVGPVR